MSEKPWGGRFKESTSLAVEAYTESISFDSVLYAQDIAGSKAHARMLGEQGIITREEARTHPRRNIITRALGTQGDNLPDLLAADIKPGDLWLLCTDGLCGMISDEEIARVLSSGATLEMMAGSLIEKALDAGGRDNVTLVLCREEEG